MQMKSYSVIFFMLSLILTFLIKTESCYSEAPNYCLKTEYSEIPLPLNKELNSLATRKQNFSNVDLVALTGEPIKLCTTSGLEFDALFFDRNSKNVMLLGQPFPGNKEFMLHHVALFEEYDILIFDYRWTVLISYLLKPDTILHPLNNFIFNEKEEIIAAIEFLKFHKNYVEIVGLGECYSNFLFIMAQADAQEKGETLFTKIILDSCWLSFAAFAESISLDPMLPISPIDGGCPNFIKSILSNDYIHSILNHFINSFVPRVDIEDYITQVYDTPLLFIHGIGDKMVPFDDFNKIWDAIPTENTDKVALLTPFQHCNNMWDNILYKNICKKFIESSNVNSFIKGVIDPTLDL